MMKKAISLRELTEGKKKKTQDYLVYSSLLGTLSENAIRGGLMLLFIGQVLGFSGPAINLFFTLFPLVVILRIPFINVIKKFEHVRVMEVMYIIHLLIGLALLLTPIEYLSFEFLIALVTLFCLTQEIGTNSVWVPLVTNFTSPSDRGMFWGRLKMGYQFFVIAADFMMVMVVGSDMTHSDYRLYMAVVVILNINAVLWLLKVPRIKPDESVPVHKEDSIFEVLKNSKMLRGPLVISTIQTLFGVPALMVYISVYLEAPAVLIIVLIMSENFGQLVSYPLWGRLMDTIGIRTVNTGLFLVGFMVSPILLFFPDFRIVTPATETELFIVGTIVIAVFGFMKGSLFAGIGITANGLFSHYLNQTGGFVALNLLFGIRTIILSAATFIGGLLLEQSFNEWSFTTDIGNIIWIDTFKLILIVSSISNLLIGLILTITSKDYPSEYGVRYFFTGIFNRPTSNILYARKTYSSNEAERLESARRLSHNPNPVAINGLLQMLNDPSYDVKVETVRTLSLYDSAQVKRKLREILGDKERAWLWEHVIWSLGQLRDKLACDLLIEKLSPRHTDFTRSLVIRALGKIGNLETIPIIIDLIKTDKSKMVRASCGRALLRLNAEDKAEEIFRTFIKIGKREEVNEMTFSFCERMQIHNTWIFSNNQDEVINERLTNSLDYRTELWLENREEELRVFRERNFRELIKLVEGLANRKSQKKLYHLRKKWVDALVVVLKEQKRWNSLHDLASALVLYSKEK